MPGYNTVSHGWYSAVGGGGGTLQCEAYYMFRVPIGTRYWRSLTSWEARGTITSTPAWRVMCPATSTATHSSRSGTWFKLSHFARVFFSVADPDPRIHMFLGLLDPDPNPLVRNMDPDSDPSIIKQKQWEKPWFLLFCDFVFTFYLWKMMLLYLQKVPSRKTCKELLFCWRLEG